MLDTSARKVRAQPAAIRTFAKGIHEEARIDVLSKADAMDCFLKKDSLFAFIPHSRTARFSSFTNQNVGHTKGEFF